MWRPSSPSGRPRPPRRSGTALASWSETIRTGARPSGFSIRTGSGSAGESRDKGRLREGGRREGGRFVVVRNRAEVNGRPRPSRGAGRALRYGVAGAAWVARIAGWFRMGGGGRPDGMGVVAGKRG